jgi:predicted PurR-regulated permease PerM
MITQIGSNFDRKIGLVVMILLIMGCLLVLRPFVSSLLWAAVLCCAGWPLYNRLLRLVRNRRSLAASAITIGMILLLLLPFVIVGSTLADNVQILTNNVKNWLAEGPPAPPGWLGKIPIVGTKLLNAWQSLSGNSEALLVKMQEWVQPAGRLLLKGGLLLGHGVLELAMSIFIAFFFFRDGTYIVERLNIVVARLSGERGGRLLEVAGKTIRGVVYGILGTALAQAVLMAIGFLIAGVPAAALLALLTFFSSVVPVVGTTIVWLPAAAWLYNQGSTSWAIFLAIWGIAVGQLDNFIKPWLISQGSQMPFLLIFFGVIGGAVTFGFIGVFLGPTLLAVGYRLMEEWDLMRREEQAPATTSPAPSPKT